MQSVRKFELSLCNQGACKPSVALSNVNLHIARKYQENDSIKYICGYGL
jgi:hypothetical protein